MTNSTQSQTDDARNSFTGKTLTDSQFDESWALVYRPSGICTG
jgi:hypothetical protein